MRYVEKMLQFLLEMVDHQLKKKIVGQDAFFSDTAL